MDSLSLKSNYTLDYVRELRTQFMLRCVMAQSGMTKNAWKSYIKEAEDMIEFLEGRLDNEYNTNGFSTNVVIRCNRGTIK